MIPEEELITRIYDGLKVAITPQHMTREPTIAGTGRQPDIVIDPPNRPRMAVEVENDAESLRTGIGQASEYSHATDAEPVVMCPLEAVEWPDHLDLALGSEVTIVPVPVEVLPA